MIKVYLHGSLKQFGEVFELEVVSAAEAMLALTSQIKGMREVIASGQWQISKGNGDTITDESIALGLRDGSEIHVIPAVDGAGGIANIFKGITLIGLAGVSANKNILSSLYKGISGSLTGAPKSAGTSESLNPDERPSFLYDGATNTSKQGLPVPIIYGRIRAGSIVISAGLTSEQI